MKRLEALVQKYQIDARVSALEPRIGTAYEEICAVARDLNADLIVAVSHPVGAEAIAEYGLSWTQVTMSLSLNAVLPK